LAKRATYLPGDSPVVVTARLGFVHLAFALEKTTTILQYRTIAFPDPPLTRRACVIRCTHAVIAQGSKGASSLARHKIGLRWLIPERMV